jgi:hypothetical protein
MKMKILRYLIAPWFFLFLGIVGAIIVGGVHFGWNRHEDPFVEMIVGGLALLCLYSNLITMSKAGIWIADSIPQSVRRNQLMWLVQALIVALIAYGFYLFGQLSWVPLICAGIILPVIYSFCLFYGIRCLIGPILVWSSRVTFIRMTAMFLTLPVFYLVIAVAVYIGDNSLTAYQASLPEFTRVKVADTEALPETEIKKPSETEKREPVAENELAKTFKDAIDAKRACSELNKTISAALVPTSTEDVAYWAVKAVKCSDLKSVIALPKLAKLMVDHESPLVRAASIRAMPKFGIEDVKRIAYLLVKRLNEKETIEVMDASVSILSYLGEEERKSANTRLKNLLDNPNASSKASKILVENLRHLETVTEYVNSNLAETSPNKAQAISMICALPKNVRQNAVTEANIHILISTITNGDRNDEAIKSLECMEDMGYMAVLKELKNPTLLKRNVAAKSIAEMKPRMVQETLETVAECAKDPDLEVRTWCDQTLGRMGEAALPRIMELIESDQDQLRDSGILALSHLEDPNAKPALMKIRAENSGWMANKRKLVVAQAIDKALSRIENITSVQ